MRVRIVPPEAASKIVPPEAASKIVPPEAASKILAPEAVVIPLPEPGRPEIPPPPPLPKGGDMPPEPVQPATPVPQAAQVPSAAPSGENTGSSPIPAEPSSTSPPQVRVLPGNRTALFDPKVIEQYGAAKKEDDAPIITLDTAGIRRLGYLYKMKDKIERIWEYPPGALKLGITGELYIKFTIREDGSLGETVLLRTSGNPFLDNAALDAVRQAAPFLPLPKQWEEKKLVIVGRFIYLTSGANYIR